MKKLIIILVCILILVNPLSARGAVPEKKVVRVGWYESAFHRTDQNGRRSGYGYEYQQRIATFTGWEYEYVEGSWSELLELLIAGEIDLLSDVSYTAERAAKILYSANGMGSEDYHAFIAPGNTEIRPDDFSTFNGKRVGVNKNSIQAKLFSEWTQAHGITPEIVELTIKTPEMLEMLADGDIDILVTLDAYGKTADVIPVCKIGAADSYFGVNKDRPDIKQELDTAMNRILEENRYFAQELAEKYNSSEGFNTFLTPDEEEWNKHHGTIRVGYRKDYLPYCGLDQATGSVKGALSDFLQFAESCERNARLNFDTLPFDTYEEGLQALIDGEIDCLFPVSLSAYDGEQSGVIITDTFVKTEMYAAVRTADRQGLSPDREMTVALISGNPNFETFLMDHFPGWGTVYYEDAPAGFRAVGTGEVDCVLVTNHRLNRMNELFQMGAVSAKQRDQAAADLAAAESAATPAPVVSTPAPAASVPRTMTQAPNPEAVKQAELAVKQAEAALENAKQDAQTTDIVAPVAGTVYYSDDTQEGTELKAGQTIASIGDDADVWVEAKLSPNQKDSIRLGQFVSYTIDGKKYQGTVTDIKDPADAASQTESSDNASTGTQDATAGDNNASSASQDGASSDASSSAGSSSGTAAQKSAPTATEGSADDDDGRITVRISLPKDDAVALRPGMEAVVKFALNK